MITTLSSVTENFVVNFNPHAFFWNVFSIYIFLNFFFLRENGFEPDLDSYGALLIVYGEAGNLEAIMKVFII